MTAVPQLLDLELHPDRPPLLRVTDAGDPADWVREHRAALRAAVDEHGVVLVRGLGIADVDAAAAVVARVADRVVPEQEPMAPRTPLPGGLHSSTPWPATQQMCAHQDGSHRVEVPSLLVLTCLVAPAEGGATGVVDGRRVLAELPADVVERFTRLGWQLTRTVGGDLGASVAEAFGSDDPAAVAAYCAATGIDAHWREDGSLRTRQVRPAVVVHPRTGERCWCNQVAFLSEWTMDPDVREYLLDVGGDDGLPFATAFGDGSPVDAGLVELLADTHERLTVREPWQAGDLMLVDNIRCGHGRDAYTGPREVVVALCDPVRVQAAQ